MSLIKCNECGKEVSDKSKQCIHCGCPIEEEHLCVECGKKINIKDNVCKSCGCPIGTNIKKNFIGVRIWNALCSLICIMLIFLPIIGLSDFETNKWMIVPPIIILCAYFIIDLNLSINKFKLFSVIYVIGLIACLILPFNIDLDFNIASSSLKSIYIIAILISYIISILVNKKYFEETKKSIVVKNVFSKIPFNNLNKKYKYLILGILIVALCSIIILEITKPNIVGKWVYVREMPNHNSNYEINVNSDTIYEFNEDGTCTEKFYLQYVGTTKWICSYKINLLHNKITITNENGKKTYSFSKKDGYIYIDNLEYKAQL